MEFSIRSATATDLDAMLSLLPRLGELDLIPNRDRRDLWQHDAALLRAHFAQPGSACFAQVAYATNGGPLLGMTLVRMQPEFMSHAPSAHLEAIAVSEAAEGQGVGSALLDAAEATALARGAESMTLHVYHSNTRAAELYNRRGYHTEILRCTKWLEPAD